MMRLRPVVSLVLQRVVRRDGVSQGASTPPYCGSIPQQAPNAFRCCNHNGSGGRCRRFELR
jgi:hypothetical protein